MPTIQLTSASTFDRAQPRALRIQRAELVVHQRLRRLDRHRQNELIARLSRGRAAREPRAGDSAVLDLERDARVAAVKRHAERPKEIGPRLDPHLRRRTAHGAIGRIRVECEIEQQLHGDHAVRARVAARRIHRDEHARNVGRSAAGTRAE